MKNRTSLLLMEQLVMVLVFALAAAVCLQIFAQAGNLSREAALTDGAAILAQNAAEMLKATGGDQEAAESLAEAPYRMEIQPVPADVKGLCQVRICIYAEENLIFTLQTGWQEVDGP